MKGVKFNGVHCKTHKLTMTSSTRHLLPENKDTYVEIPHKSGSFLIPDKSLKDIFIDVNFTLKKDTLPELFAAARLVAAWLTTNDRRPLIFDDDPTYIYNAKVVSGITLEQLTDFEEIADFTVSFRCDPFPKGAV